MDGWPILSTLIFLPLAGAALIALLSGPHAASNARWIALWTTLVNFAISLVLWWMFDPAKAGFQFVETAPWLAETILYRVGVDGISLPFILLTTFLLPLCILASWESIEERVGEYMIAFLVLETLVIGVFAALDLVLFYLFFEGGLIPMFLIIGIWGGPRRVYAAFKFFLYTLLGSLLMLVALMAMYLQAGTTDIVALLKHDFPPEMQTWLWLAFFASFAVKLPMWPVHTWLPDAHVEAPTAGSVILAGILLKLGGYGFVRFSLPMFPDASIDFAPLMFALSVIAIVYTSLVALMQEDVKKLIAYSSVAHMGFVTLGLFSLNRQGVDGAVMQMISHGFISAALFLCVGVVYDRMHTREIKAYGGLANRMPIFAAVFMIFTMGNVGLPGTSGFVGEFLSLMGAFQASTTFAIIATLGVILSAAYALWLYARVIFGELDKPALAAIPDMNAREISILAPLILATLGFGVYPKPIFDLTTVSVEQVLADHKANIQAEHASPPTIRAGAPLTIAPASAKPQGKDGHGADDHGASDHSEPEAPATAPVPAPAPEIPPATPAPQPTP
ncbi:MAG TPA: NADH-quinone oxidoreductase subunit M [Alphaproteobacteria bacterium]|nr:NADH-quinone oxidoreductase subunit M [Alphaproteobacteria bacterium]HAJ46569.1 NADH-quinone oxidoreductase subunit M [Alphaproteobacteria bacterium]